MSDGKLDTVVEIHVDDDQELVAVRVRRNAHVNGEPVTVETTVSAAALSDSLRERIVRHMWTPEGRAKVRTVPPPGADESA